jgi:hypothetical protein
MIANRLQPLHRWMPDTPESYRCSSSFHGACRTFLRYAGATLRGGSCSIRNRGSCKGHPVKVARTSRRRDACGHNQGTAIYTPVTHPSPPVVYKPAIVRLPPSGAFSHKKISRGGPCQRCRRSWKNTPSASVPRVLKLAKYGTLVSAGPPGWQETADAETKSFVGNHIRVQVPTAHQNFPRQW